MMCRGVRTRAFLLRGRAVRWSSFDRRHPAAVASGGSCLGLCSLARRTHATLVAVLHRLKDL